MLQKHMLIRSFPLLQNFLTLPWHGPYHFFTRWAFNTRFSKEVTKQGLVDYLHVAALRKTVHQRCTAIARTGPQRNHHEYPVIERR